MTDRWHAPLVLLLFAALTVSAEDPAADIGGNEASAIGALKTIATSQSLFREGDKDANNELDYAPNLQALADTHLISKQLGTGKYRGYRFKVSVSPKAPEFQWMATAVPIKPGVTGERYFAVNHAGVVYHALTPFKHNAECKVNGTPVGRTLKGWTKKRSKPEGPFGKAFQASLEADFWKGQPRRGLHFATKEARIRIAQVRVNDSGRHGIEAVTIDPKLMKARVASLKFDDQGRLGRIKIEAMKFPPQRGKRPERVREAKREGGKLTITEPGSTEPRTVTWKPNTITVEQALFILPRLVKHLPAALNVNVAKDGEPLADPLKVGITGSDGDHSVTLTHAKLGEAVVTVKGGAIQAIKDFDGAAWRAVSMQEARELFMKNMKGPGVKQLIEARKAGNEMAAIGALKTISISQALFREADKDGNGRLDYAGNLGALGKARLIDTILASGVKQGFRFKITRSKKSPEFLWMATAEPVELGKTGTRYFAVNHAGVIYHALKPFKHNESCKIAGVPVGQELPGWKRPSPPPSPVRNEARAIGAMRMIGTAQALFREGDKDGDGILDYAENLKQLIDTKLVSKASLERSGYVYSVCNGSTAPEFIWMAVAAPQKPVKGSRYFATNHEGVTYYSDKPIMLDTKTCKIPQGLKPVGR